MVVYLDNSFLNRPFDDPEAGINKLEAEILLQINRLVKNGKVNLVSSSVIEYENSLNPFPDRKIFVKALLKQSTHYQNLNQQTRSRAQSIAKEMGATPIDALHLASAEQAAVDLFITCDYNLIKKYQGKVTVISPLDFFHHYEYTKD